MYCLFNKEENRIVIENNLGVVVLSGELGNSLVTSVKPREVSFLKAKFYSIFYKFKAVQVEVTPIKIIPEKYNNFLIPSYLWLQFKKGDDRRWFKVWSKNAPSNNSSKLLKDGTVIIKGIGSYPLTDFNLIEF